MAYVPEFAELIVRALARLDRSPSWLAQRIDVNPSTVSRWLNQGARPGDPETVVRIADVLGMTGRVQELLSAAGFGYVEMGSQGRSEDATAGQSPTPPAFSPPRTAHLPAALTPFLGRGRELAELARLLADAKVRLLSIVGPGGMGKSRLAVEAARRATERYPDGVWFVPLAALQTVEDIVPAIAGVLGFSFQTDARPPQKQLLDYLREKALLLVLDNFEHLIGGAGLVTDSLQTAPRVKIVVTSRERLRLSGETVYQLDGMDFPDGETPPDAEGYSAVQLFAQSARFAQPDFVLQPEEVAFVVRICRGVYGTPLGILLAASWVGMLSLPEIADEIERSLDFLAADLRDLPERQRSLRAVFDHSWRLLGEAERQALQQMSTFRGGFTRQAAQEILGAGLPILTGLYNKSLLQRTETGRYELHELVRQYAAEKEGLQPASAQPRERHARYYLALLRGQMDDLSGRGLQARLATVASDLENIRVGWSWAMEVEEAELIGSALESLCRYYEWQGRYAEGAAVGTQTVSLARSVGDRWLEASALISQADFRRILGDQTAATHLLQESASALVRLGESGVDIRREEAALALGQAQQARDAGDGHTAKVRFSESIALYEAVGDLWATARALGELSYVLRNLENIGTKEQIQRQRQESGVAARRSVAICRQIDNPIGLAEGLLQLCAWNPLAEEAEQALEESLALYSALGIESGVTAAHCQIVFARLSQGRYEEARRVNALALQSARRSGNLGLLARSYLHGGMADLASEAYGSAKHLLEESVTAARAAGVRPFLALSLSYLGYAERGLGNVAGAQKCIREALTLSIEIQSQWPVRVGVALWALLAAERGEIAIALEIHALCAELIPGRKMAEDVIYRHFERIRQNAAADVVAAAQKRGEARNLLATAQEILSEIEGRAKG